MKTSGYTDVQIIAILRQAEGGVVLVNLPEQSLPLVTERSKVMFAVRVVVLGEGVECPNLGQDCLQVI